MTAELKCIGCKKSPEKIEEYISNGRIDNMTPSEWVRQNEAVGCWGPRHGSGGFYCTSCYIRAGMPLRRQ